MKRAFDIVVAAAGLFVLALPMLAIALAVRLHLGKPVFFVQLRPGRHGVPFRLIKFRTMREAHDASGALLPDEQRLTHLGRLLRATSLDELPELWNVLRGEMSLVGPRPLLMEYLPLYTPEQARRHEVRPGMTGWAQVNGRNAISWESKFAFDLWYVDHQSFLLDLRILWRTLIKVLAAEGISPADREIMERFAGSTASPEPAVQQPLASPRTCATSPEPGAMWRPGSSGHKRGSRSAASGPRSAIRRP